MTGADLIALAKKHPVSAGCGLLSVALAVAIYFRADEIPAAETELAQKSAEGERYSANLKNATQLKEQVEVLAAANKEIESRILSVSQLGTNVQYFYKLESETGTKLLDIRQTTVRPPAKTAANAVYFPVAFSAAVKGDYAQLLRFLYLLESGAHYCRVLGASCTVTTADRAAPLTLTLSLELLGQP